MMSEALSARFARSAASQRLRNGRRVFCIQPRIESETLLVSHWYEEQRRRRLLLPVCGAVIFLVRELRCAECEREIAILRGFCRRIKCLDCPIEFLRKGSDRGKAVCWLLRERLQKDAVYLWREKRIKRAWRCWRSCEMTIHDGPWRSFKGRMPGKQLIRHDCQRILI